MPADGHSERLEESRLVGGGKPELLKAPYKPRKIVAATIALGSFQPFSPGSIHFDESVLLKKRQEARPDRAHRAFVVVVVPCNLYVAGHAPDEPANQVKAKRVLHAGAGDAGNFQRIEVVHVDPSRTQLVHALPEVFQEILTLPKHSWAWRKSPQYQQGFMKSNQGRDVSESCGSRLGQDLGYVCRFAATELIAALF